jgi:hypothetical protein
MNEVAVFGYIKKLVKIKYKRVYGVSVIFQNCRVGSFLAALFLL